MSTPRLSAQTLHTLRTGVAIPPYDRAAVAPGIVHFGPGAFMKAHLASFIDSLLRADPRWGIAGVSLRTAGAPAELEEQDFLYTLTELTQPARHRVLGALCDVAAARALPRRALAHLMHPAARLITVTVTEKGYGLDATGKLDVHQPDVARDLASPPVPASLVGWLTLALTNRRAAKLPLPIVMSCDNLASNGPKLRQAVIDFARASGRNDAAHWIEDEVRFPATMVDSITPASDAALGARVSHAIGATDLAPVQREPFAQWVIEDNLGRGAPDLASVGAQLTRDVHAYERAKLRLLNGTHSALAYIGLSRGHATVYEAMRDAELARFVERMMRDDIAPTLRAVNGLDIPDYISALLARLRNPAVAHRLSQIAADGSQKLPYRFLEPIADLLKAGRPIDRLCVPVAAWMRFVYERRNEALDDPIASKLQASARSCTGDPAHDVGRFLLLTEIFPPALAQEPRIRAAITRAYDDLRNAII
ncbi:MAG: mannitol dehydrogenase family protein [Alphaproteobacteria bacterium]|nr:mannitol dehydrogenase family protein [Alphaproteobacteria bacterium]MBL6937263.1 mannitol dehydrogenase family protein [Alphaproteobacteria bacterium]MBL7096175.1 mannitol dehydrogenase family protein [Alphaproteobacteria bacterium]